HPQGFAGAEGVRTHLVYSRFWSGLSDSVCRSAGCRRRRSAKRGSGGTARQVNSTSVLFNVNNVITSSLGIELARRSERGKRSVRTGMRLKAGGDGRLVCGVSPPPARCGGYKP